MAAAVVDFAYLATHLDLPEATLSAVATDPTAELVRAVLEAVEAKAHEFDTLYSEKLQVDIELENVARSSEARCQQSKATADKALKDVEEIRHKLQEEETSRQALENQLQTTQSSSSTSVAEIEMLRARITSLETSNRETLAILETKNAANAELADELQKRHQKILELRQEMTSLQQAAQSAQSTLSGAKFREQSLQQELDLVRRNVEWFETELKTKSTEALKHRKEKGARIAELQRLNEEANSNLEALQRNERQLRSRLEEAQRKIEDSLAKTQQLQEAAAKYQESFRQEIEGSRRLVELSQQQQERQKERLQEVENRLSQVKDEGADEVRRIRQDLEQERQQHEQTGQRVLELEAEIDQLQAMLSTPAQPPQPSTASVPHTPRTNGSLMARAASPFGTPGSIRSKSAITASQAIEELYKVKGELAGERRRNQNLTRDLDEMMSALEAKGPEMNELQEEAERLRNENIQMTRIADESFQERDLAKKTARKAEAEATAAQAELKILRGQLRDLSTQVQLLLFNMHAREKGLDNLSEMEIQQFERLQRGEITEDALNDLSDTHQFISEKFVAFKDIYELQTKNEELLRITRELADQMENEEALEAKQQAAKDHEEVTALRDTVSKLQDEAKSITIRMKSYMTERDMFRRMLQQKASAAEINSVLGNSVDGREVLASIEQNSTVDDAELTTALRELQTNFDTYRNEQGVDRKTMREQMDRLSNEKNSLQADVSKISSQLTLASERYEMLHSNFVALQTENQELQKRSQNLSQSAAKQDIRIQQVAEDLIESRGMLESMRSENANLKAEKTLWKGIQDRLNQDNENLIQEKNRLNNLLATQQSLQNERDLNESETRRRLQNQIDGLEAELKTTKRKLDEETKEAKQAQLRKDYDAQQSQKRIDGLLASLTHIKEENASTKTSRDLLQARVNELTVELRNAEERATRLQPRPTPRPGTVSEPVTAEDDAEARLQELADEVSDLKRDLDLANTHLENAKAQADQFKELSQATEEELESLNNAQELYREEMDATISSKDAKIKELEQRVEDLSTELANSNRELSVLRDSQAEVARKFEDEKRILESDIIRLKDSEQRFNEVTKAHRQDLRAQAEIASKAQQDYEQELVRHAEAAKQLQILRAEHNKLKNEAVSWKTEAESARHALAQSEGSWEERKAHLEQELEDLRKRRDDTNAENKLLHQQLDSVTAQISALKQSRASLGEGGESTPPVTADTGLEGLKELNGYLRREKEILEVQHELKNQECRRLQSQMEYMQSQLDEARLKLEQERRAQADSGTAALAHKDLMEKLNQLNILRESNATLRSEGQRTQKQLAQKVAKIEELTAKIQPLEVQVSELESQKTFMEEELKQVQEDRDRWQKRMEGILANYGRTDPAEMEQLKQRISELEAERDNLVASGEAVKEKADKYDALEATLDSERNQWKENRAKLIEQAKERDRKKTATINEMQVSRAELQTQLDEITEKLTTCEKELEESRQQKTDLETDRERLQQQVQQVQPTPSVHQPDIPAAESTANSVQVAQLEGQLQTLRTELESVNNQKAVVEQELEALRAQLATAVEERDQALIQAQKQTHGESNDTTMQNGFGSAEILSDAEKAELEERVKVAEAKVVEIEERIRAAEEEAERRLKERSEKMKNQLTERLKQTREDYQLKLEQEKAIWMAEHGTNEAVSTPAKQVDAPAPSTPTTGTPSGLTADLSKLGDAETRDLLANNPTVKSIVANNLKKRIDAERAKIKEEAEQSLRSEYENKVTTAREQATMMESKKSTLRINMAENKLKTANAKLGVVEAAAKNTPQQPVGEVWEVAKAAKPAAPPATTPVPAAAATNTTAVPAPTSAAVETKPQTSASAASHRSGLPPPGPGLPPTPAKPQPAATTQNQIQQTQQPTQQAQPRTGLPVPSRGGAQQGRGGRGGGAQGGGVYQHPGQRGQANNRGSRGGNRNVSGSLNPGATDFNPGNKRPRDSETGVDITAGQGGAKRMRGGRGGAQHQ